MPHTFNTILLRCPLQSLSMAYDFPQHNQYPPFFIQGIYLSSPEYWREMQKDDLNEKDKKKINDSLYKYWIRSCTRSTPYGTYAGVILVDLTSQDTQIVLSNPEKHSLKVRLDMNYMDRMANILSSIPAIQKQLKFYTNNSIYELFDEFRYVEYSIIDSQRKYHLASIEKSDYVELLLKSAQSGKTIDGLIDLLLSSQEDITMKEAEDFILEMIESQLLSSELEIAITGIDPLSQIIEKLSSLNETELLTKELLKIQDRIQNQGTESIDLNYFFNIENDLSSILKKQLSIKNIFQADLFLSAKKANIDISLINIIINQASDLMCFSRNYKNMELQNFISLFYDKYEDAEIPLPIALDNEMGVGYAGFNDDDGWGDELTADVENKKTIENKQVERDIINEFITLKYYDYLKNNREHIEIDEDDLKLLKEKTQAYNFPNSYYTMGNLIKNEDGKLNYNMIGFGGPPGATLLSRFAYGDPKLCSFIKQILTEEESNNPEAIYAEIVHLPESRIGNVLLRPILRDFEIPYIGKSGTDIDKQLPINDIMVSIRGNEVYLRSKKYNRRIIPRLTTAHNFALRSLPIYKFLCDTQFQNLALLNVWDWGDLENIKHLPKVTYKNIILKRARWVVEEKDIENVPSDEKLYKNFFDSFRNHLNIPYRVVYVEGDNELLIDFQEMEGINLFLHYIRKHKKINLHEFLFNKNNCIVTNDLGEPFVNEVIIPLYPNQKVQEKVIRIENNNSIQRKFPPNSEWIYFKVYCGNKTAEKILKEKVLPFIKDGMIEKKFDKFFFLRYKDNFTHFRIRFYNKNVSKQMDLQDEFLSVISPLINENIVSKVLLDTYNRELERYGNMLIDDSESIFFYDSICVLKLISLFEGVEGEKYRFLLALRGIDVFLDDFQIPLPEKRLFVKEVQSMYFKEFGAQPSLQKTLNSKYRNYQKDIFSFLNSQNDKLNEIEEAIEFFNERSVSFIPVIKPILLNLNGDNYRLYNLMQSYIHMFLNRLFVTQQRKYELIVYHFLEKYYSSRIAITKQ